MSADDESQVPAYAQGDNHQDAFRVCRRVRLNHEVACKDFTQKQQSSHWQFLGQHSV